MSMKGIDVSSYQGKPDWEKVKESGIEFAILRVMNSKGKDSSFEHNYQGTGENGIFRGVYRYSYALTVTQAKAEAQGVLAALAGRKLELGVWLDLEWSTQRALGKAKVRQIAEAWMEVIRNAGYECNVYCNLDWYKNVCGGLDSKYWIARYPANDKGVVVASLKPNVGEIGWQYSSKGKVPGISDNVDLDEWYGALGVASGDPSVTVPQNPYKDSGKLLKYNRLTVGFAREDVRWLQWELREAGYELVIDGKFGPKTDLALRAFQAEHPSTYSGRVPDGICGSKTRAAFKEEAALAA